MKRSWVYLLLCADQSFYLGVTSELESRVAEHRLGRDHPTSYTYSRRPVHLVYSEEFPDIEHAIAREKQLKGWSRAKKIALIGGKWEVVRALSRGRGSR